jgi:acyl dehydratase
MRGLYFEEFEDGMEIKHAFTRTVTEMDNVLFTSLTMNVAPIHLDEEYSRKNCRRGSGCSTASTSRLWSAA